MTWLVWDEVLAETQVELQAEMEVGMLQANDEMEEEAQQAELNNLTYSLQQSPIIWGN